MTTLNTRALLEGFKKDAQHALFQISFVGMAERVRVEIKSRDHFWARAFYIEWEYQFPDRRLIRDGTDQFLAELEWLSDLERVGSQTFSSVTRAPDNPRRRKWMSSLISGRGTK